ncbi:uncharacterized protein LOC130355960 isoform X3 [Hyla sarda]|uniref:uncharacterized protein LOC130355960 isoform X3 n=1 Tax=Hyla sarda TaxID=327740 RepID=UPI0024C468F6|nr:uncharacterized protein LOC130355960 isoform X3 [Hyla sarda]
MDPARVPLPDNPDLTSIMALQSQQLAQQAQQLNQLSAMMQQLLSAQQQPQQPQPPPAPVLPLAPAVVSGSKLCMCMRRSQHCYNIKYIISDTGILGYTVVVYLVMTILGVGVAHIEYKFMVIRYALYNLPEDPLYYSIDHLHWNSNKCSIFYRAEIRRITHQKCNVQHLMHKNHEKSERKKNTTRGPHTIQNIILPGCSIIFVLAEAQAWTKSSK